MGARERLYSQIVEAAANVLYTYSAHWKMSKRLSHRSYVIKIAEIALTALSTGGFLASLVAGRQGLGWVASALSALALSLNLYDLNFKLPEEAGAHEGAANELWVIRESYKSLLTDFDDMASEDIRAKRDELSERVAYVNKSYPGTDEKAFRQAQKDISKYQFSDDEAAALLHVNQES